MKKITDILPEEEIIQWKGKNKACAVNGIAFDSREVKQGNLFVAIKGTITDGHLHVTKAVEKGAFAVVCEKLPAELDTGVDYIVVKQSARALGLMASGFYNHPSSQLSLVGITGTNGKTTTATLLYQLFKKLGYKTGLFSTVANYIHDKEVEATRTTPDPVRINQLLMEMVAAGCTYVFMEVSSHAVVQERIAGIKFSGGVFTNITHDHLDYHETFRNYIAAKKKFFDGLPAETFSLVNSDDKNGKVMVQNTLSRKKTYGLKSMADFRCRIIEQHPDGMLVNIDRKDIMVHLIGEFNGYNLLCVYGVAILLNQDNEEVATTLSQLTPVNGRFEFIRSLGGKTAIVDYAHTPDALENVLKSIVQMMPRNRKLTTVIGAGGNRDKSKRPLMAKIAAENSQRLILTSDNPRDEDPEQIIEDMKEGIDSANKKKTMVIVDRAEAIRAACLFADDEDFILIAGKGHEKYQEVKGEKYPFDDKEIVNEIFKQK